MPMSNADLERPVVQNKNDVDAVYEMLTVISATLTHHGRTINSLDGRFDSLDANMAELLRRLPA